MRDKRNTTGFTQKKYKRSPYEYIPQSDYSAGASACRKKNAYLNERMALKAIAETQEWDPGYLRAYKCHLCKEWHLTSQYRDPD